MIGLLTVGTVTMMLRGTQARQKAAIDSLEASKIRNALDVAHNRVKFLFINHPMLLRYSSNFWETALLNLDYSDEAREFVDLTRICQSDDEWKDTRKKLLKYSRAEEIDIENNNFFRLINFSHTEDNKAIVTIQATNKKGSSANLQGVVRYEFYYVEGVVPGLWTEQETKIRSEISGNVWLRNCLFPAKSIRFDKQGYEAKYVRFEFPALPNLSEISDRIPDSHIINLDNNYEGETSFPRSYDSHTRTIGNYYVYEYVFENVNSNAEIEFKTVVDGKPVMIIINAKKGIQKGKIKHTCEGRKACPAQNLVIINHAVNENNKMCFVTDKLEAFVFSPYAGVGFIKKSNSIQNSKVIGAIWTKELISDGECGKRIKLLATLTLEQIIQDLQIISPYPKITEFSEFKPVNGKIVEAQLELTNPDIILPDFRSDSIPVFIDEKFNSTSP